MCGIAGIFAKDQPAESQLGANLASMLEQLAERGPDSSGAAIYRDSAPHGHLKISLLVRDGDSVHWPTVAASLGGEVLHEYADQALLQTGLDSASFRRVLSADWPSLQVTSCGAEIETFKRAGLAERLIEDFEMRSVSGTHGLGHTRMATESRVTTEHSHPFSTGEDLCLVHNGSLSNHNRLRSRLRFDGIQFETDNDSEVAAGFIAWQLREGASLEEALSAAIDALDGFYTFAVGTRDGFAVLRDPIACKPAIIAETDSWVAMASEYRAIAVLPGAADAEVFEPDPGRIHSWSRGRVAA